MAAMRQLRRTPQPRRAAVEGRSSPVQVRRLTIDYERLVSSSRAMIRLAAINLMLRRL